jgi:hypothetical protein
MNSHFDEFDSLSLDDLDLAAGGCVHNAPPPPVNQPPQGNLSIGPSPLLGGGFSLGPSPSGGFGFESPFGGMISFVPPPLPAPNVPAPGGFAGGIQASVPHGHASAFAHQVAMFHHGTPAPK